VIAISEMTRDDLVRHHDLPEERITIVHNGVDTNRFRPMPADERRTRRREAGTEDRFTLLFAGHNFRLKGLGTVLRALARLRSPRLHLLVAGRGQIEKYRRLADRLGVSSQVTFAGFIPDMREAYALADAFVQPTFYDPCSLVILEAAACGLPVVTSRFNGAAELFRDGVSAFILRDPGDAAETARSIETLFDPGIRSRVTAAGLLAAGEATAEKSFQKLLGICMHTLQYRQAA
jgi:UDP-glucose:(heptosyl)LPS alpha-1,3-glucosyltransferase